MRMYMAIMTVAMFVILLIMIPNAHTCMVCLSCKLHQTTRRTFRCESITDDHMTCTASIQITSGNNTMLAHNSSRPTSLNDCHFTCASGGCLQRRLSIRCQFKVRVLEQYGSGNRQRTLKVTQPTSSTISNSCQPPAEHEVQWPLGRSLQIGDTAVTRHDLPHPAGQQLSSASSLEQHPTLAGMRKL